MKVKTSIVIIVISFFMVVSQANKTDKKEQTQNPDVHLEDYIVNRVIPTHPYLGTEDCDIRLFWTQCKGKFVQNP